MKVLVTGGAGFIGSHVVDKLADAGHEPVIFDVRPSPHHVPGEVETRIGDLLDPDSLRAAMEDCDAVAHLAAAADVGIVAESPADAEALNSRGTLNVLEAARATDVERVVYASTIWVYSDAEGHLVNEDATVGLPGHLYTATKLAGEMYCKSYGELYDLEFTILRFGIPYGPRARPAAVIPSFVNRALDGEPLTIAGTGDQSRRFVYVEDLAEGVAGSLCPKAANRIFNLVSNEDVTIRQIADTVRKVVGEVEIVHGPGRAADFNGVEVCGKRAARELGWTASTPFDEGVRRYVAWHREERERAASVPPAPEPVTEPSLETLPVLKPARVPAPRRYPRLALTRPLARAAAFTGLTLGIVGMLTAYLIAMHSVGLDNDEERTVGAVSVILLGFLLVPAFDWRRQFRRALATTSWIAATAYVVALLLPWSREKLDLASPDAALLLLGIAGAGLGLALAIGGHRLVRSDPEEHPSEIDA